MINSWEEPEKCCILIKAREYHTHADINIKEIMNLLETFTVILRGTETGDCPNCKYRDTYGKTGQCIKRIDYDTHKNDAEHLNKCLTKIK